MSAPIAQKTVDELQRMIKRMKALMSLEVEEYCPSCGMALAELRDNSRDMGRMPMPQKA